MLKLLMLLLLGFAAALSEKRVRLSLCLPPKHQRSVIDRLTLFDKLYTSSYCFTGISIGYGNMLIYFLILNIFVFPLWIFRAFRSVLYYCLYDMLDLY